MKKRLFTSFIAALLILLASTAAFCAATPRVAVVLGYYPPEANAPDPYQTERIYEAWHLYASGTVDTIVVSGGYTREYISEARMGKIALVTLGVPPSAVYEEERSSSTLENALFSAKLFDEKGWEKRALIVSQKIHLYKAKPMFEKDGFKVKMSPTPDSPTAAIPLIPAPPAPPPDSASSTLIVVYEPYNSDELLEYPTPGMARRLRAAAAAYRENPGRKFILYSDWYTRGPIDPAEVMKIALCTLGVPSSAITAIKHVHYGNLANIIKDYKDQSALLIAPSQTTLDPVAWPGLQWKLWPLE